MSDLARRPAAPRRHWRRGIRSARRLGRDERSCRAMFTPIELDIVALSGVDGALLWPRRPCGPRRPGAAAVAHVALLPPLIQRTFDGGVAARARGSAGASGASCRASFTTGPVAGRKLARASSSARCSLARPAPRYLLQRGLQVAASPSPRRPGPALTMITLVDD